MSKAGLQKNQKHFRLGDRQALAGARRRQPHQRRFNFGRWLESAARDGFEQRRRGIELRQHREIAVVPPAGFRRQPQGHLPLHYHVDVGNHIQRGEQPLKNRRRDVVGQVAIDPPAVHSELLRQGRGGDFQDIGFDHCAPGLSPQLLSQRAGQRRIFLHRYYLR